MATSPFALSLPPLKLSFSFCYNVLLQDCWNFSGLRGSRALAARAWDGEYFPQQARGMFFRVSVFLPLMNAPED